MCIRGRQQVRTLNALVCEALAAAGLEPVPILPSQALRTAGSQTIIDFPAASFEAALEAGLGERPARPPYGFGGGVLEGDYE